MDNPKTVILKIGYSRLREVVVYEGFNYNWENFGVSDRWSLIGGSTVYCIK